MNKNSTKLSNQLLYITAIAFLILFLMLGLILPKMIIPIAEDSLYSYLNNSLKYIDNDNFESIDTEVAYIYINSNIISSSNNTLTIIKNYNDNDIVRLCTSNKGKFKYKNNIYYYYLIRNTNMKMIAITNDNYINNIKTRLLSVIFTTTFITFTIIAFIFMIWSLFVVKKIQRLKYKIDNIDNNDYDHSMKFRIDDEIRGLYLAIEDMRKTFINQEEYRNTMYQNISHDFKTPLSVIKSYIEAVEDKVEDSNKALNIIKEQTDKLEYKVKSLLYLNKLDYLKDNKIDYKNIIDISSIINSSILKLKFVRKDIKYNVNISKSTKIYGTYDNWEAIVDNLLNNFMRYAKSEIKINIKAGKIYFYNDGENIDKDFIESMFIPFRKGTYGEFGLGLSIVKKSLNMMGYDISVRNEKVGVTFIIFKNNKKKT